MQLTFDSDVEAFRAEFVAFLDENLPTQTEAAERSQSMSHMPEWARRWQRLLFDNGWLLPGNTPEFGGRNATRSAAVRPPRGTIPPADLPVSFNPQGVEIIAASLLTFGTRRAEAAMGGADPARRHDGAAGDERARRRL